jgi:hypothetical protein
VAGHGLERLDIPAADRPFGRSFAFGREDLSAFERGMSHALKLRPSRTAAVTNHRAERFAMGVRPGSPEGDLFSRAAATDLLQRCSPVPEIEQPTGT